MYAANLSIGDIESIVATKSCCGIDLIFKNTPDPYSPKNLSPLKYVKAGGVLQKVTYDKTTISFVSVSGQDCPNFLMMISGFMFLKRLREPSFVLYLTDCTSKGFFREHVQKFPERTPVSPVAVLYTFLPVDYDVFRLLYY